MKLITKRIMYTFIAFMFIFMCETVNAANYGTISSRINQNSKMINEANSMNAVAISSYTDLTMKELGETNHTALTLYQQNKIKQIANTILGTDANIYTDMEKMEKFYNWILDNYYKYDNPQKINLLSTYRRWDNPFYLLTYEYIPYGKVRAKSNGFASTLVAFARTQNIPARLVGGYYNANVRDDYKEWGSNITKVTINNIWVEAYTNGTWKMFDPYADSNKEYNEKTSEYIDKNAVKEELDSSESTQEEQKEENSEEQIVEETNPVEDEEDNKEENTSEETENQSIEENTLEEQKEEQNISEESNEYVNKYFNPDIKDISKTHIAFQTYAGSSNLRYISETTERSKITTFLNYRYNNVSNGSKINKSYNTNDSLTWFSSGDTKSITNGFGRVQKIYWPAKKSLMGNLNLENFKALEILSAQNNKIKTLRITNAPALKQINVSQNQLIRIMAIGSNQINYFNANNNPATYIEYNFYGNNRKAFIKASGGGTVSAYYKLVKGKNTHVVTAKANSGYDFIGWYNGKKKISKNKKYAFTRGTSFTYVAKFKKKPPAPSIKISISKQKLWFYRSGKVIYKSNVVTGKRYSHDTPTGKFSIRGKARNVYLIGPDYKSYVEYWMPIYGDIGLHDASWRWSFGGTIYKYNGSHGCVNLPVKTAKYIYKNAPVGTTVKIVK